MKYLSFRRVMLIVVITLAAAELSRGIFNPMSYDVFERCFSGELPPTSFECEYAPQIMIQGIGGLVFLAAAIVLGYKSTRFFSAMTALGLSLGYILLQLAMWRFEVSISDNFRQLQFQPPETFHEYLYTALLSLDGLLIGLILALLTVLGYHLNKSAIPASRRHEPRQKFAKRK